MFGFQVIDTNGKGVALDFYNQVYELWYGVWLETYKQLVDQENMDSDQFLLNDYAGVITYNKRPVAMFLMSYFHKDELVNYKRSYLLQYPEGLVENAIRMRGCERICLYSNITVHSDFRKNNDFINLNIAELQFALACSLYEQSNADVLFGYTRNSKLINSYAYSHGGTPLSVNSVRHNQRVDFIGIYKEDLKESSSEDILKVVESIFSDNVISIKKSAA